RTLASDQPRVPAPRFPEQADEPQAPSQRGPQPRSLGDRGAAPFTAPFAGFVLSDQAPMPLSSPSVPAVDQPWETRRATNELLSTAQMTGPLRSAGEIFGQLDMENDLREQAVLIGTGPRADLSAYEWGPSAYTWISPAFYHLPLYFEQPNLERYGIGRGRVLQPLLSSAHFFGSIPLLPYKSLQQPPWEKVYTLGQGRPGNCVPIQRGVLRR
ncbi:MAG: hypothetical protein KDA45_04565, partial [Planctomycetales bacterium]|nr:hypothetical protein [Planctomycetales bacterium]